MYRFEIFGSTTVRVNSTTPYSDATQTKKHPPGHVKRPMNAFMVWSQLERRRIVALAPDSHNAQISKQLGQRWKMLSEEQRKPYKEEAQKLKILHQKEYPNYKYRPKKKTKQALNSDHNGETPSTSSALNALDPKSTKLLVKKKDSHCLKKYKRKNLVVPENLTRNLMNLQSVSNNPLPPQSSNQVNLSCLHAMHTPPNSPDFHTTALKPLTIFDYSDRAEEGSLTESTSNVDLSNSRDLVDLYELSDLIQLPGDVSLDLFTDSNIDHHGSFCTETANEVKLPNNPPTPNSPSYSPYLPTWPEDLQSLVSDPNLTGDGTFFQVKSSTNLIAFSSDSPLIDS